MKDVKQLRELIKFWRSLATPNPLHAYEVTYARCANELEATLNGAYDPPSTTTTVGTLVTP